MQDPRVEVAPESAQLAITHLAVIAAAEHSLRVVVMLELEPVGAGILQKKGPVLQPLTAVTAFGGYSKGFAKPFDPLSQQLPVSEIGKHKTEVAGIDARLIQFGLTTHPLEDQLMTTQIEDAGKSAAPTGPATQNPFIPSQAQGQVAGRNREVKTWR